MARRHISNTFFSLSFLFNGKKTNGETAIIINWTKNCKDQRHTLYQLNWMEKAIIFISTKHLWSISLRVCACVCVSIIVKCVFKVFFGMEWMDRRCKRKYKNACCAYGYGYIHPHDTEPSLYFQSTSSCTDYFRLDDDGRSHTWFVCKYV